MITIEDTLEGSLKLGKDRHICGKHVILLEGPAGAGKTYLLSRLGAIREIGIVRGSLGKRSFRVDEAGKKSFVNDNNKFMDALLLPESVVVIDRCVASQKVYHAIRTDREVNFEDMPPHHVPMLMLDELEGDLAWRLDRRPRRIHVYWMFLIPTAHNLRERRKGTEKTYPNKVEDEIYHYKKISNFLLMEQRETLRPSYESFDDQDLIVNGFIKWMTYFPHLTFSELWKSLTTVTKRGE